MQTLTEEQFDELIYDEEAPSLILFHRSGCHVCEELEGLLEELAEEYTDVTFGTVDVEAEHALFSRFGLKGVPQVILFADGSPREILSGQKDDAVYEAALSALIGA